MVRIIPPRMLWRHSRIVFCHEEDIVGAIMTSAARKGRTGGPEAFTVRQSSGIIAAGIIRVLVFAAMLYMAAYALRIQGTPEADDILLLFGLFMLAIHARLNVLQCEIDIYPVLFIQPSVFHRQPMRSSMRPYRIFAPSDKPLCRLFVNRAFGKP
jgi:hypothetical protein